MKKYFLFISFLISISGISQNFPGIEVQLLQNKKVKVIQDQKRSSYLFENFYTRFDQSKNKLNKMNESDRAFPVSTYISDYNKLAGKEFLVEKIYETDDSKYFVLELQNEELGKLYYDYDTQHEFNFELEVVGGLELPDDYYCKQINKDEDKFNEKEIYITEYSEGICLIKTKDKEKSEIAIKIDLHGKSLNVGHKGVYMQLEDQNILEWPEVELSVKRASNYYIYSARIVLSQREIELLSDKLITGVKLFIYEGEIKNGFKIKKYLNCLISV